MESNYNRNKKDPNVMWVDLEENAIDFLETAIYQLLRDDSLKWKSITINVIQALYSFCIANLTGTNPENVMSTGDMEDNNRYIKVGNDQNWQKSRIEYNMNSKGYKIYWKYIEGDPVFESSNNIVQKKLLSFWQALARVQDGVCDMARYIHSVPLVMEEDEWQAIEYLKSYSDLFLEFDPCSRALHVDEFKKRLNLTLNIIEFLSLKTFQVLFWEKETQDRIEKDINDFRILLNTDNNKIIEKFSEIREIPFDVTEVYTEGNNASYLEKAKKFFASDLKVRFIPYGGKNHLKTHFERLSKLNYKSKKLIFIFDYDALKDYQYCLERKTDNLIPLILIENKNNKSVISGIENLFDETIIPKGCIKDEITIMDDDIKRNKLILDKRKIYDYFCIIRSEESDFKNFKTIIEEVKSLL